MKFDRTQKPRSNPRMGKESFYAVAVGRVPGVYMTWPEAQQQVAGFQNAKYKKFATREEAETFVATLGSSILKAFGVRVEPMEEMVPVDDKMPEGLVVFTDGSSQGNGSKHAKAGYSMVWPNHPEYTVGKPLPGQPKTNNRAEFSACIDALKVADVLDAARGKTMHIYTDSQLLINSVTKWLKAWKKNGWKKADGTTILNQDLVMELDALSQGRRIHWHHVPAHTGGTDWKSKWNDMADRLAKESAE